MKKAHIKTTQQIDNIREAGKYLTELLHLTYNNAKPGVVLLELEQAADQFLRMNNVRGAFKWYQWFPANLCLSINDCVVHGIPDETILQPGDVLKIDVWVTYNDNIADAAISMVVGGAWNNKLGQKLIESTKKALDKALPEVATNKPLSNFARTIFKSITWDGFNVLKNLTWHGVGIDVHEWPYIYNRPHPSTKSIAFEPGMVVALEPITAMRSSEFVEHPNQPRNIYTKNWDVGAQWEYTVAIHPDHTEVLAGVTENLR